MPPRAFVPVLVQVRAARRARPPHQPRADRRAHLLPIHRPARPRPPRTAAPPRGRRRLLQALPLYHENRPAPAPSGTLILGELEDLAVTTITAGTQATIIPPHLTPIQQLLITLLEIPAASYHQTHDEHAGKSPERPAQRAERGL